MAKIKELVGPGGVEKVRCARSVDDRRQGGFFEGVVVSPRGLSIIREAILKGRLKPHRVILTPEQAKRPTTRQAEAPSNLDTADSGALAMLREENSSLRRRLAAIENLLKDEKA